MSSRARRLVLVLIMAALGLLVAAVAIFSLYRVAFEEEQLRLVETAQSQARLIEAVARFDAIHSAGDHSGGAAGATLGQITDAHRQYEGFGETGEFTLAMHAGDQIVFLLRHRHYDLEQPRPVPFDSELAEPMRRALSGHSGSVIAKDYRGVRVLAAHEPVAGLDWGIVAKIDLAEIRAPFVKAGLTVGGVGLLVMLFGVMLFFHVSNPLITDLEESEQRNRLIVETALDGHITADADGVITSWNPQAESMFGWSHQEVVGKRLSELIIPPRHLGAHVSGIKHFLATGEGPILNKRTELTALHRDGHEFPVELRVSPFQWQGAPLFSAFVSDINERKQAEERLRESEQRLRTLVE
jgi:PAS domain S-box-containing protein